MKLQVGDIVQIKNPMELDLDIGLVTAVFALTFMVKRENGEKVMTLDDIIGHIPVNSPITIGRGTTEYSLGYDQNKRLPFAYHRTRNRSYPIRIEDLHKVNKLEIKVEFQEITKTPDDLHQSLRSSVAEKFGSSMDNGTGDQWLDGMRYSTDFIKNTPQSIMNTTNQFEKIQTEKFFADKKNIASIESALKQIQSVGNILFTAAQKTQRLSQRCSDIQRALQDQLDNNNYKAIPKTIADIESCLGLLRKTLDEKVYNIGEVEKQEDPKFNPEEFLQL